MDEALRMNAYNLNDEQLRIIRFLDEGNNIASIKSVEDEEIHFFARHFIVDKLLNGFTCVIRVPNFAAFRPYAEFLSKIDLEPLYTYLNHRNEIIIKKQRTEVISDQDYQKESIRSLILYQHNLKKVKALYSKYNEPIFGEYTRPKLAELLFLSRKKSNGDNLDLDLNSKHFIFSKKEFWYLRGRIEKASKFYKSDYGFIKVSDELNHNVYKDFHLSENREIVFKYFQKYISDCQHLIAKYKAFFLSKRAEMIERLKLSVKEIEHIVDDLELQVHYFRIDKDLQPSKKTFLRQKDSLDEQKQEVRARYNLLLEHLDQIQLFRLKPPLNSWNPDIKAILQLCEDVKRAANSSHQLIISKVEDQLEVMNSNNSSASDLRGIMNLQQELINALNGSKILSNDIQNLSISAWKNFLFIKDLNSKLKKNLTFLEENVNYGVWRSFEFSLEPKALEIVNALENKDSSLWVDYFEFWYFKALSEKFPFEGLDKIQELFHSLEESKFVNNDFHSFRIQNIFDNKSFKASKSERSQWNSITKNRDNITSHRADIGKFLHKGMSILQAKFPIIVVEETYPPQALIDLSYDYLLAFNNENLPVELLGNSHFNGIIISNGRHFKTEWKDKISKANNYQEKKYFSLNRSLLPQVSNKKDSKLKLDISRTLSSILKQTSFDKKFYSAKDFSIISCMTPFASQLLEMELFDHKIKALKYADLDSGIVEDVMMKEDKHKIILFQDGFLDPSLDEEWQISVLRQLQQLGIKVVQISSMELASGNKECIIDFINLPELNLMKKVRKHGETI